MRVDRQAAIDCELWSLAYNVYKAFAEKYYANFCSLCPFVPLWLILFTTKDTKIHKEEMSSY